MTVRSSRRRGPRLSLSLIVSLLLSLRHPFRRVYSLSLGFHQNSLFLFVSSSVCRFPLSGKRESRSISDSRPGQVFRFIFAS